MGMPGQASRYVIISPVKDEGRYVETTIRAVLRQTLLPCKWVLVDDGSKDNTREIIAAYARQTDWIVLVTRQQGTPREPGAGVIRAFNDGLKLIADRSYDYIVKLDCDADFAPDYFERLLDRFQQDCSLGIASGGLLERHAGMWNPIAMPPYHAAGLSKMVRAECFRDIGGFLASAGWDTCDQIKAQFAGWKTGHFPDIQCFHLKPEGSGIGLLRTYLMHGRIYYLTGGGQFFFALKLLYYAFVRKPFFLASAMMLWGYSKSYSAHEEKLVSTAEAQFYRDLLNHRITDAIARVFLWWKQSTTDLTA